MATQIERDTLTRITNNFSDDQKVGSGGFGDVYKAIYNEEEIAVKLLHATKEIDDQLFMNELSNHMKVQHPNIVRLVGYCNEEHKKYVKQKDGAYVFGKHIYKVLCFEYMKGGSLDKALYENSLGDDWRTHYQIIKGTCEGLCYLHRGCGRPILHLDLKPANILLDDRMNPKIADFGLSRIYNASRSHQTVDLVAGARKYMPPELELIHREEMSEMIDVFSLGVTIIDVLKGPENSEFYNDSHFLQNVVAYWRKRDMTAQLDQVEICAIIAIRCMHPISKERPTIEVIMAGLNGMETQVFSKENVQWLDREDFMEENKNISIPRDNSTGHPPIKQQNPATPEPEPSFSSTWVGITSSSKVLEDIILDERAEPTNLSLSLLQHITKDFAEEQKIGRGGFGVVYKVLVVLTRQVKQGDLQKGSVAVKRLLNSHTIEEEPFYREATSLISVKHQNIVRFLGYCSNTESKAVAHLESGETSKHVFVEIRERLLCFEYINNGSLEKYITDELTGLEWHTRYQIIRGICNGLVYLHEEKGIVHRDMKPANILLDDFMIPKITDFGISKLLEGATHVITSNSTGSFGYCAPEFIHRGVVSMKSDIFSLGIIIIELVTGSKVDPDTKHVLRRWRYRWNKSANYPPMGYAQVTTCIDIALMCLSESPERRPYIWDIVSTLNKLEKSTNEFPVGPISPYPWELLEFDKLELNFPFQINKPIPCSLELTNVTDNYVAFDIGTTGALQYGVEPDEGVVPPRSSCNVMVTLQALERVPHAIMCKDAFVVVRCAIVDECLVAQDITKDMFDTKAGKAVDEVTLKVAISSVAIPAPSSARGPLDVVIVYAFDCSAWTPAWYAMDNEVFWLVQEKLAKFTDSCMGYIYVMLSGNTYTCDMKIADSAETRATGYTAFARRRVTCYKNMASGLSEAHKMISNRGYENGIILLFSDGLKYKGDFFDGAENFASKVPVHTFTFDEGDAYNHVLRSIAAKSPGGRFHTTPVPERPTLSTAFSRLLDNIFGGNPEYDEIPPSPISGRGPLDVVIVYAFDCTDSTPAWHTMDNGVFWLVQEKLTHFPDSCMGSIYVMSTDNTYTSEMKLVDADESKATGYTAFARRRLDCTKNMASGLPRAHKMIRNRGHRNGIILFFSDGLINKGDFFDGTENFISKVPVHTFTLGGDAYNHGLQAIAKNSPGGTFNPLPVPERPQQSEPFSELLDRLLIGAMKN